MSKIIIFLKKLFHIRTFTNKQLRELVNCTLIHDYLSSKNQDMSYCEYVKRFFNAR